MPALRRLLVLLLLSLIPCLAHGQAYTSIVVIGDSLSDTGNDTHVSTAKYTAAAAVPAPATGYTQGRFTDGLDTAPAARLYQGVWIEQLAAMLAAKPPVVNSLDGGSNYAYGFAFTGSGTANFTYGPGDVFSFPVNNMGLQLSTYLATSPTITNKTLFVVWGGANDLLNATSQADVMTAVVQEVGIVQTLANAGATDFLVVNQPPLGSIPRLKGDPADAAALTAAAAAFNQGLQLLLPQVPLDHPSASFHIYQLDVFSLFNSVIASPSTYGLINVTDSSQGLTTVDPDTYLFWDGLHPTTAGHHQLALAALSLITPGTTSTSLSVSPMAADFGASITLTATVSSTSGIAPGTVTFYDGTTALGTAQLSGASPDVATITTSSLASGSHSLTAVYAASQYFTASTSSAVTEVIATPAIAASISPVGLSVTSGSSGTVTISVAASGGFAGTVGLSCDALPSPLTCSFAPGSLVFAGGDNTLTSTLTINTAGNAVSRLIAPQGSSSVIGSIAMCSLLPIFGLIALRRRVAGRVVLLSLVLLLSFGAVLGLSGCGSNSSSGAHTGNYSVSVNVSTGTSTTTQSFVVTVTK